MHGIGLRILGAAAAAGLLWAARPAAGQSDFDKRLDAAKDKAVKYLFGRQKMTVRIFTGKDAKPADIDAKWEDVVVIKGTTSVKVKGKVYEDVTAVLPPGWFDPEPTGNGQHYVGNVGGQSALATLALLSAGVSPKIEPKMKAALDSVLYTHTAAHPDDDPKAKKDVLVQGGDGTYFLGLHASALEAGMRFYKDGAYRTELFKQLERDARRLENGIAKDGGYNYHMGGAGWDLSNTQYGILGLWAAARGNVELKDATWKHFNQFLLDIQTRDGGWGYRNNDNAKPTMTAAGVASLFVCMDQVHTKTRGATRPDITPFTNDALLMRTVQGIENGIEAYGRGYKPGEGYLMYGTERIGVASGYKYFGTHDWFREGAAHVLKGQKGDGSWAGGHGPVCQTSWNLMFLVFGGAPVLINKLQHGPKGDWVWHNYPRDAANLASWYGRSYETLVNWQVLSLATCKEDDLMDAPILYIGGYKPLAFGDEDVDKLRRFVEKGGTLLFVACGSQRPFVESVVKLGERIYPAEKFPEYQFTEMPKDHPVYSISAGAGKFNPVAKIPCLHMHNGHRSFAFLVTEDINHLWHGNRHAARREAFEFVANLKTYCTDKGFLPSKIRPAVTDGEPKGKGGGALRLAVIKYTSKGVVKMQTSPGKGKPADVAVKADWVGAPMAWRLYNEWFRHVSGIDIQEVRGVELTDPQLKSYDVLHITGHHAFVLSDEEKKALKDFVASGGSVLFEPVGGVQTEFFSSARDLVRGLFPDKLQGVTGSSPLVTGSGAAGRNLADAGFSRQVRINFPDLRNPADKLLAVDVGGRPAVVVSPFDLSLGMSGQNCWERLGFSTKTSRELVANFLVLAKSKKGAPVAAAAAK
jgi:hypothetical protein